MHSYGGNMDFCANQYNLSRLKISFKKVDVLTMNLIGQEIVF